MGAGDVKALPLILSVLFRDYGTPDYDPYEGRLV